MATRTIVKQVPNAVLYSDGTIRVDNVRLSYPHLFAPWAKNPAIEKKKYGATGIMLKSTHKEAQKLIVEVMNKILAEKNKGEKINCELKFLRDGEPKDEDGTPVPIKPEYAGAWICVGSEREERPPSIRGRSGKPVTQPTEKAKFYAGCFVNVLIRPWWQDNDNGKRINANLVAVQWVKDGPQIGEAGISEDEIDDTFEQLEDEAGGGFEDDDDL